MAVVIIKFKIMPESPDVDMDAVAAKVEELVKVFAGDFDRKKEIVPVAFGLNALNFTFVCDEAKGGTDGLEQQIMGIEGVGSVEVIDVRRALG